MPRGTEVRLHLKEDAKRYLEPFELERLVRTYSDHILFPIELVDDKGEARQVNAASALWQRAKSEVKPEDYTQAYRSIAMAFDEPALTLHYKVEGRQSYAVLLFVPSTPPFDLADPNRKGRIKLYVRRVFITDDADLLPPWLRFVRGVVDSEDLPLNISREMLQNNPQVTQIRNGLVSRVIGELESTADKDAETYGKIWNAFGPVLKEGLYEDQERRGQLLALTRFATTAGEGGLRSLKQYVADLKPNQTEIYYLVGESAERVKSNPKLEAARARGIEVLLLTDPIDAFWTMMPQEFEGKPLKSLSQGDVDFGLVPLLDQAAEQKPTIRRGRRRHQGGQGRAGRQGLGGARLAAADGKCRLPRRQRAGPRSRAGAPAGAPESRQRRQAHPRAQHGPRSREGAGRRARRKARGGCFGHRGPAARPGPHPRRRGAGRPCCVCQTAQCVRGPWAARRRLARGPDDKRQFRTAAAFFDRISRVHSPEGMKLGLGNAR